MTLLTSQQHFASRQWLNLSLTTTLFACALAACGGGGGSSSTASPTPAPTVTAPGVPAINAATAGDATASISFTAPTSNGGAAITGYTATCTVGSTSRTGTAAASPVVVLGLTNGTTYSCSVAATNSAGTGAASTALNATPAGPAGGITPTAPGAPTIGAATAGVASASISFTAPASNGGAAITGYTATCTAGSTSHTGTATASPITVASLTNGTAYSCSVAATNSAGTSAASVALSVTPAAATGGVTNGTAAVLCGISGSEPTVNNLTATYSWTCNGTSRALVSNGLPNHTVGTFPRAGNPNTIGAVATSATYTLNPTTTATKTDVVTSGYGLNGVKIEPGTAGTCGDAGGTTCNQALGTGAWNMEALGQTAFNFGTDENNAHVQPTGAYHYHGMPEQYIVKLGKGVSTMTLVGWAPDGFPIYARYGYNTATNAASGVKILRGSYRLKTTPDANRPSTTTYAMGTFTQDYEYAAGSGDLDECNGRTGVTPEFPAGIYHYMMTDTYPYIGRCVKGTPASIR